VPNNLRFAAFALLSASFLRGGKKAYLPVGRLKSGIRIKQNIIGKTLSLIFGIM
jgi:hypothetical protein